MTAPIPLQQQAAAARARLMLWCGALILLLQLFAAVGHDHEVESSAQDCVACSVQAQSQAAPPPNQHAPDVTARVLAWNVASIPLIERSTSLPSFLLPQPHAPPAFVLSA